MFVFENVLGILTAKRGEPFADLKRLVEELGYKMDCKVQIASEHGVLQDRHRVIIVGWKDDQFKDYSYPILEKESMPYAVMKDLFSDLPLRKAGEGNLCGIVSYTKPLSEMKYLKESGIRGVLSFTTQHVARPTNDNDRQIYKIAVDLWHPDLLEEADDLAEKDRIAEEQKSNSSDNKIAEITLDLVRQMVEWDKRRRILEDWKWKAMKDVVDGKKDLSDRMKYAFYFNLQILRKKGFQS